MCPAPVDWIGRRFGKLTVLERVRRATHTEWRCRCDCGKETVARHANLHSGCTNSCGCIRNTQGGLAHAHPMWARYASMLERCNNPRSRHYKNYGERGITVCERWLHFPSFLADMEPSFKPGMQIDRINNDLGYSPENCRWATSKQNTRNRRVSVTIDTPWGPMNQAEAAERAGIDRSRFKARVSRGWLGQNLFDPAKRHKSRP
jgi:hypothetical protein